MRELKFRAWDKINNQMLSHDKLFISIKNIGNNEQFDYLQYTTRKDKYGKEIYDGDIMNFKDDKRSPSGGQYCGTIDFHPENAKVVEWTKDRWTLGSFCLSSELNMYEVVGNIFENPEMVGEKWVAVWKESNK